MTLAPLTREENWWRHQLCNQLIIDEYRKFKNGVIIQLTCQVDSLVKVLK